MKVKEIKNKKWLSMINGRTSKKRVFSEELCLDRALSLYNKRLFGRNLIESHKGELYNFYMFIIFCSKISDWMERVLSSKDEWTGKAFIITRLCSLSLKNKNRSFIYEVQNEFLEYFRGEEEFKEHGMDIERLNWNKKEEDRFLKEILDVLYEELNINFIKTIFNNLEGGGLLLNLVIIFSFVKFTGENLVEIEIERKAFSLIRKFDVFSSQKEEEKNWIGKVRNFLFREETPYLETKPFDFWYDLLKMHYEAKEYYAVMKTKRMTARRNYILNKLEFLSKKVMELSERDSVRAFSPGAEIGSLILMGVEDDIKIANQETENFINGEAYRGLISQFYMEKWDFFFKCQYLEDVNVLDVSEILQKKTFRERVFRFLLKLELQVLLILLLYEEEENSEEQIDPRFLYEASGQPERAEYFGIPLLGYFGRVFDIQSFLIRVFKIPEYKETERLEYKKDVNYFGQGPEEIDEEGEFGSDSGYEIGVGGRTKALSEEILGYEYDPYGGEKEEKEEAKEFFDHLLNWSKEDEEEIEEESEEEEEGEEEEFELRGLIIDERDLSSSMLEEKWEKFRKQLIYDEWLRFSAQEDAIKESRKGMLEGTEGDPFDIEDDSGVWNDYKDAWGPVEDMRLDFRKDDDEMVANEDDEDFEDDYEMEPFEFKPDSHFDGELNNIDTFVFPTKLGGGLEKRNYYDLGWGHYPLDIDFYRYYYKELVKEESDLIRGERRKVGLKNVPIEQRNYAKINPVGSLVDIEYNNKTRENIRRNILEYLKDREAESYVWGMNWRLKVFWVSLIGWQYFVWGFIFLVFDKIQAGLWSIPLDFFYGYILSAGVILMLLKRLFEERNKSYKKYLEKVFEHKKRLKVMETEKYKREISYRDLKAKAEYYRIMKLKSWTRVDKTQVIKNKLKGMLNKVNLNEVARKIKRK